MPNVSLTKQMREYAEAQVASGAYANVSEVVRAGMRKLMADEDRKLHLLREEIRRGVDSPTVDVDVDEVLFGERG